jgi:FtsH-binding integral membrane protein
MGGPTGATVYCKWWLVWSMNILMLVCLLACHLYKNEYPLNYIFLLAFTLSVSVVVGITCSVYRTMGYEDIIVQALVMTAVLFVSLTLWTMQSRINFDFLMVPFLPARPPPRTFPLPLLSLTNSFSPSLLLLSLSLTPPPSPLPDSHASPRNTTTLQVPLFMSLMLLIVAGFLARVFHSKLLYTAYALPAACSLLPPSLQPLSLHACNPHDPCRYAYCGSLLFCFYIIYDTHMICNRLGYDDYIVAAIEIYLDLVNLFLYLLKLLASSRN